MSQRGWIGVDLDRTLAYYDQWKGADHVGEPIKLMADRVRNWLAEGQAVKIVTARVSSDGSPVRELECLQAHGAISDWCVKHFGQLIPVTCEKDFSMLELWDDRAIQLIPNTGIRVDGNQ